MIKRAKENLELTRKKIGHAVNFFNENNLTEAIHYIWVVFENCINIFKDIKNNKPVYQHKPKIEIFSLFYSLNYLKKDYSRTFELLEKLRIRADFGEYSKVPKIPDERKVKEFLNEAINLFNETEKLVKEAIKKRKLRI